MARVVEVMSKKDNDSLHINTMPASDLAAQRHGPSAASMLTLSLYLISHWHCYRFPVSSLEWISVKISHFVSISTHITYWTGLLIDRDYCVSCISFAHISYRYSLLLKLYLSVKTVMLNINRNHVFNYYLSRCEWKCRCLTFVFVFVVLIVPNIL